MTLGKNINGAALQRIGWQNTFGQSGSHGTHRKSVVEQAAVNYNHRQLFVS
jgi:hypothetical protein